MSTIVELQQRAAALKAKYQKETITPEEVGQLHEDTLAYIADLERYVDNLGVRKTYFGKTEMDADVTPVGTNGKAMRYGQLAVIRSSDNENGNIYAYQKPGWLLVGNLNEGQVINDLVSGGSNVPLSAEQGKVLDGKIEAAVGSIPAVVDNLTTDNPTKVLSARQGKILKNLYDDSKLFSINYSTSSLKADYANEMFPEVYMLAKPAAGSRYVVTYLSLTSTKYYLNIAIWDGVTSTAFITNAVLVDGVNQLIVNSAVAGYVVFDSSKYNQIANQGEGVGNLPYISDNGYTLTGKTRILDYINTQNLNTIQASLANKIDKKYYFDCEKQDYVKRDYARNALPEIYMLTKPAAGSRYVVTYLSLTSTKYYLNIAIWDGVTSTAFITNAVLVDGVNQLIVNSAVAGYVVFDSSKYNQIANQGEGVGNLPYISDNGYTLTGKTRILDYINTQNLNTIQASLANKIDKKYYFDCEKQDYVKRDYARNALPEIYMLTKPVSGSRYVLTYLNFTSSNYYITIALWDGTTATTAVSNLKISNGVSELRDTSGILLGYVFLDTSKYNAVVNQGEGTARLPYITEVAYDISNSPRINSFIENQKINDLRTQIADASVANLNIKLHGDSITWGSAASTDAKCYAGVLKTLIANAGYKHRVVNCGIGGESFQNILVRQGAFGLYIDQDFVIPALSSEKVQVQSMTNYVNDKHMKNTWYGDNSYFGLMLQGETGRGSSDFKTVNPLMINGIECTLVYEGTQKDSVTYIKRNVDAAAPTTVKAGTIIYLNGPRLRADIAVYSIGTNDGFTLNAIGTPAGSADTDVAKSVENYIAMVKLAIAKEGTAKVIVCSPYGGTALTRMGVDGLKALESALSKEFGARFFNWRKYLNEEGLQDAGLATTAEDTAAISEGKVPPQLLSDGLHPNDYGHDVIGRRLYYMIKSLGYLE